MESAINIFKNLPETKEQVKDYTRLIKESVLNGEVEPLQFAATVSALEQLFKALKADHLIKDVILEEAEKYRSKSFEKGNAKFQVKEVGVKYDFKNCNDSELEQITNDLKELTEERKKRETLLKAIDTTKEFYDGNGVQLFAPIKTSTTQVVVILK
jgi:hypothetical protein